MPSTITIVKIVIGAVVGLAVVAGGLSLASLGYSQYGHCGSVEISVAEIPAEDIQTPDEYTSYESLTSDQQAAFERGLETGEAYLPNRTGFPHITYEDSFYIAEGPTVVCDFEPTTVMGLGGAIALLGVIFLGWTCRKSLDI